MSGLLRLLAVLSLALCAGTAAHAAIPVQTCVAPLHAADSAVLDYSCAKDQRHLGPGDFGVQLRFAPVVSHADDPLVLRHTSVWQNAERVVFHYADGTIASASFTSRDARRFMSIGAIFELPVPVRAAPLDGIFIEIKGAPNWRGVLLGAELMRYGESEELQRWLVALYAGFGGISLALLAYNLALWAVLRHRFQLTYAAMVASLMAYTFTSSSLAMKFLPELANNDRLRCNYVLLSVSAIFGLRFMQDFFGPGVIGPRLTRLIPAVWLTHLSVALAFAVAAPMFGGLLDRLYFVTGALTISLLFPIIWAAWRARVRSFWLFLLAWSAPIGVTLLRSAHGLGLIGYSFWLDNGNLIALSIEAMLSSALIVTRLRELSRDRDNARASEQSALRLANSDPLTGLLNRRAFLDLAVGRGGNQRLLLIDIDHFKTINDRLGHDKGDEVLCAVAHALQSARPADSLAVRLGGEEFALLLPAARQHECRPEDVLAMIRRHPMPMGIRVTASMGFAEGPVHTHDDWKRLYRFADAALYRAKADGRDRVCRATDFGSGAAVRLA